MHTEIHRPFPLRNWRALAIGNQYSYITLALYLNLPWTWCLVLATFAHVHLLAFWYCRWSCFSNTANTYHSPVRLLAWLFKLPSKNFVFVLHGLHISWRKPLPGTTDFHSFFAVNDAVMQKSQHAGSVAFRLNHYLLTSIHPCIHPSIHTNIHADRHTWHTDIHIYNIIQLLSVIHRHV